MDDASHLGSINSWLHIKPHCEIEGKVERLFLSLNQCTFRWTAVIVTKKCIPTKLLLIRLGQTITRQFSFFFFFISKAYSFTKFFFLKSTHGPFRIGHPFKLTVFIQNKHGDMSKIGKKKKKKNFLFSSDSTK